MRKLILTLLMASVAATPALADRPDRADREQARAERQEQRQQARQERQQVREQRQQVREQRVERTQPQVRQAPSNYGGGFVRRANNDAVRAQRDAARQQVREQRVVQQQVQREQRRDRIEDRRDARQQAFEGRRAVRTAPPVVSTVPRFGTQPPLRAERHRPPVQWNTNWRHDHRYDWRNWRDRHRSTFRLGFYYDPFGWGYQRYSIGWRLWPAYYGNRFWINDPWMYRLPYAPPGTRWVRYYDDALLVDTWSGQVVDVIYDFFW